MPNNYECKKRKWQNTFKNIRYGKGIKKKSCKNFDKGFTGSNGRENEKSTGMGLYLVYNYEKSWI